MGRYSPSGRMAPHAIPLHGRENRRVFAHCMGRGVVGDEPAATTVVRPRNGGPDADAEERVAALPGDAVRATGQV
ncbi:hypothetical protein [Komagataeibacter swingsii]|uniref:Uncharacterized protein n=1 Tax=Komagataeibacter swingsii TaxID=215220 RepID=A0A2V4R2C0_9PROT|nr:hypothetical protein [Komagataeibacter swingsii]PYD68873.1 hypothetical protein CFR76_12785 [Komagataeibacter swingsii]